MSWWLQPVPGRSGNGSAGTDALQARPCSRKMGLDVPVHPGEFREWLSRHCRSPSTENGIGCARASRGIPTQPGIPTADPRAGAQPRAGGALPALQVTHRGTGCPHTQLSLPVPPDPAQPWGAGEVRGQGNIYSDVTFHFYRVGKRCWSRKRAVRDVPGWEAAVTARSQLWRARAWLGQPHGLHPRLHLGMAGQAGALQSPSWASGGAQALRSPWHSGVIPAH